MTKALMGFLLATSCLAAGAPAFAQPSDLAAEIAALRAETAALRSETATLRNRVAELEAAATVASAPGPSLPASPPAAAVAAAPAPGAEIRFRGAPQISAPGGWSFKPRGRLQFDFAHVSSPGGIADPGLGFSNELRRARLGVEGTMPGGFGYVFEMDFADNAIEIVDALISYRASESVALTVGQHNNFQSLEELTSSRFTSFIERAAFTDAFGFERRVGLSAALTQGDLIVQAGVFTDNVDDLADDADNAVSGDARIVYAPTFGETRLHLGASAHWRDNGDLMALTRYRQRPLVHSTDVRFVATPALAVAEEFSYGVEAALIRGPFHAAAEAHWLETDLRGGLAGPDLFGAYAEVGYFLTGETRGYRAGRWDRTSPRRPVGENGGLGAFQVNLRYDRLDLDSGLVRGGRQDGLQASLVWIPADHFRFLVNYGHLIYSGAALSGAGGDRDYNVDVVAARAQVDF